MSKIPERMIVGGFYVFDYETERFIHKGVGGDYKMSPSHAYLFDGKIEGEKAAKKMKLDSYHVGYCFGSLKP